VKNAVEVELSLSPMNSVYTCAGEPDGDSFIHVKRKNSARVIMSPVMPGRIRQCVYVCVSVCLIRSTLQQKPVSNSRLSVHKKFLRFQ